MSDSKGDELLNCADNVTERLLSIPLAIKLLKQWAFRNVDFSRLEKEKAEAWGSQSRAGLVKRCHTPFSVWSTPRP